MTSHERIPDLVNAYDLVGAAYQEAMQRAGLMGGMITKVNALARDRLREIYAEAEQGPTYTVMINKWTVHLSGLRAAKRGDGRTCNALTRAWETFTPVASHTDLKDAMAAVRATAKKWDLRVCSHCAHAIAWQPDAPAK
ncbi:hypothetical protein BTM25_48010 [Actinomadura rubteroloni]|uniref:Uncharacterized protein n=1 Tax=Actinomadura rubteroloni TaxID=1926885 RepID=A0A2P4UF51_9ACTN|nr:hypothetical protein [Actinomadura rubteroloni]POM23642.1 hypothetical protein BTM25_48010 [Actinomadura rubteroloni]